MREVGRACCRGRALENSDGTGWEKSGSGRVGLTALWVGSGRAGKKSFRVGSDRAEKSRARTKFWRGGQSSGRSGARRGSPKSLRAGLDFGSGWVRLHHYLKLRTEKKLRPGRITWVGASHLLLIFKKAIVVTRPVPCCGRRGRPRQERQEGPRSQEASDSRQRQELPDLGRRQKVGTIYSALSPFFIKDIIE